jgi:hypothetical protein
MFVFVTRLVSLVLIFSISACEVIREIGSQCPNGICQIDNSANGPACLVTSFERRVAAEGVVCLDETLTRQNDGLVPCELFWSASSDLASTPGVLQQCSGFLEPAGTSDSGGPRCRVDQLQVLNGVLPNAGLGFFYRDDVDAPCANGNAGAFQYTAGAELPAGVRADVVCTTAITTGSDGGHKSIDPTRCGRSRSAQTLRDDVGMQCLPEIVPAAGFDQAVVSISTGGFDCGGAPCLVHHIAGDPSPSCAAAGQSDRCTSEQDAQNNVYCSCRCDVPKGQQRAECSCPNGFTCSEAIAQGPFAGSYCVRTGTLASGQ